MNVQQFLSDKLADFDILSDCECTEVRTAEALLPPTGRELLKTVLLRADHGYAYYAAVFPATKQVNLSKLSHRLGNCDLEVAAPSEVEWHCPDCEVGVVPPFGSEYGARTVLDRSLLGSEEVLFEGNRHDEAIRMPLAEYRKIERPLVCDFAE